MAQVAAHLLSNCKSSSSNSSSAIERERTTEKKVKRTRVNIVNKIKLKRHGSHTKRRIYTEEGNNS
jgi:hypothetical protein